MKATPVSKSTSNRPTTAPSRTARAGRRPAARTGAEGPAVPAADRRTGADLAGPAGVLTHIAELQPDPENRRRHSPRNVGMIVDALQQVGAARSIVIDEHGRVLAGNGTIEAAAEAGITRVQVVDADGETIIAVRRTGLTPEQKRALALYDNRAAELASWDTEQLRADVAAGLDLGAYFRPAELADLLGADAPVPDFAEMAPDQQPRLDQLRPVVCPHCGESIDREALR